MAHIPYADTSDPGKAALVARIVEERGSLLHLYAMLLHSGPVAEGWLTYFTAIRHRCRLPGALRELVIMQVAHLNGAPYEAEQHQPIALREGLTADQVGALPDWEGSPLFDAPQQAALAYCDAMTRHVHVPADVFALVRAQFDDQAIVELTATVGGYNMVSRFLEALGISSSDALGGGAVTAPFSLAGKVAFVSGVGSVGEGWGNGRATAVLLARQGAVVFGTDVNDAAAAETLAIIEGEGGTATVCHADMTDGGAVADAFAACAARFGGLDILVNNVGGSHPGGAADMPEEVWDRQIDLNLKSAFLGCRHAVPLMEARGGGPSSTCRPLPGCGCSRGGRTWRTARRRRG